MFSTGNIPQELITDIVKHVANDRNALLNIGLVSKTWLQDSRSSFFSSDAVITLGKYRNKKDVNTLIQLASSPQCTITLYMTKIILDCEDDWETARVLIDAKLTFPAITSLTIQHPDCEKQPQFPKLHGIFPNVTTLAILSNPDRDYDEIVGEAGLNVIHEGEIAAFVSSFSASLRVFILGCDITGLNPQTALDKLPRPQLLEELHFDVTPGAMLLAWLGEKNVKPHTVSFHGLFGVVYLSAGKYLRELGSELKHLQIQALHPKEDEVMMEDEYVENYETARPYHHIDLSHNTYLETIRVYSCLSDQAESTSILWAAVLLSQITSPNLQKIIFEIKLAKFNTLGLIQWDVISKTLDNISSLKLLHFEVYWEEEEDDDDDDEENENENKKMRVEKYILGKLIGCASSGIVSFEVHAQEEEKEE